METDRIVQACGRDLRDIMGDSGALSGLRAEQFVDESFGLPTVRDILAELEKPGRDPRPEFKTATFADGVDSITDLKPGMSLEGTVTNVAAFGAFVDIGVHQDGLVHVSQLADRFVKDPHEVVKAGDVVRVRVTEVDIPRKRIGLSMRKDGGAEATQPKAAAQPKPAKDKQANVAAKPATSSQGALGSALAARPGAHRVLPHHGQADDSFPDPGISRRHPCRRPRGRSRGFRGAPGPTRAQ